MARRSWKRGVRWFFLFASICVLVLLVLNLGWTGIGAGNGADWWAWSGGGAICAQWEIDYYKSSLDRVVDYGDPGVWLGRPLHTWSELRRVWSSPESVLPSLYGGEPGNPAIFVSAPLWMLAAVFWIPAFLLWKPLLFRHPRGHCRQCGYNLTGNTSGRCPECGRGAAGQSPNESSEA